MNINLKLKEWNYKLIEWQKKNKKTVLFGYPYWLTVDPTNLCNLECRFCPTGQKRENSRPKEIMAMDRFKSIMNKIGRYLLYVEFCNWGEPLLNNNTTEMISIAKKYGARTFLSSNLNINMTQEYAEKLIQSGLDRMTISLDGASQESYEIYRKNGKFDLVLSNIKLLAEAKRKLNSKTPHLHWQFLVFKHNEHEIEKARKMAVESGVNDIGFTAPFCAQDWVSTIDEYNNYIVRDNDKAVSFKHAELKLCNWLWDAITINADGSISPCCSVEDKKDDFEIFSWWKPFLMIWNSKNYRIARQYVANKVKGSKENICTKCDHIGASNHRDITL
ncbi:MAG: radical SAM protein [Endomicrobiaceae bacterium]|nr:radical SAM protein [Endomicrobiaceae bacterium]